MRLNHNLGWTVVASHRNTIGSTACASRHPASMCRMARERGPLRRPRDRFRDRATGAPLSLFDRSALPIKCNFLEVIIV